MDGPHLVYFADPMCSWCWGFSPVIAAIEGEFGADLPIRPVMGGLSPFAKEPMTDSAKAAARSHWERVREASGQAFDFAFFAREGFVYDTEPSSRVVVLMRRNGFSVAIDALRRIQSAFYAENRDVTQFDALAEIAGELGFSIDLFHADWDADAAKRETRQDFALARSVGVRGFPTLIAGAGEGGNTR